LKYLLQKVEQGRIARAKVKTMLEMEKMSLANSILHQLLA